MLPVLFVSATLVAAEGSEKKCPISGKPAKDDVFLEVNGKDVTFCCNGCVEVYKKKIGLEDKGPGKCPISGEKASKEHSVIEKTAERVYFCCGGCAEKHSEKRGFARKADGPKTCPISGGPAKDEAGTSRVVNGDTVYFCCANCPKKFEKQLGVVDKGPGKCPVSGEAASEDTSEIVVTSKVVYFCCGGCKEKYIEANYKDGVVIAKPEKKGDE